MIEINEKGDELTLITHDGQKIVYTLDMWPPEEVAAKAKIVVGEIQRIILSHDESAEATLETEGLFKAMRSSSLE